MIPVSVIIACTACVLAGLALGWLAGWVAGYHRGRAFGWQEGWFRRNDEDKAARDMLGRFSAQAGRRVGGGK